ncbi:MAG: hypothetical protein ABUL65_01155, partial [Opitutus sp.]
LHSLSGGGLVERAEVEDLFARMFEGMVFDLTKGTQVEAVIDAVEAQAGAGGLTVSYPADCRHCVLAVAGVTAEVVCDGATLEMRFPRPGSPRELVAAFAAVLGAVGISLLAVLLAVLIAFVVALSPIWIPVLVVLGLVSLFRKNGSATQPPVVTT